MQSSVVMLRMKESENWLILESRRRSSLNLINCFLMSKHFHFCGKSVIRHVLNDADHRQTQTNRTYTCRIFATSSAGASCRIGYFSHETSQSTNWSAGKWCIG